MEVSGQLHAPDTLPAGKEAGWAPEPVWTMCVTLALDVPTELFWLLKNCQNPLHRSKDGSFSRSGCGEEENPFVPTENQTSYVQPVA
jgi:hypothetical protein